MVLIASLLGQAFAGERDTGSPLYGPFAWPIRSLVRWSTAGIFRDKEIAADIISGDKATDPNGVAACQCPIELD